MKYSSASITQRVKRAIDVKAARAAKDAIADVLAYLEDEPDADVTAAVDLFVGLRLIQVGESLSVESVKTALLVMHPTEVDKISQLEKAGINRENDYIWARSGDPKRAKNGVILAGEFMRINGIDQLLNPKPPEESE